MRDKDLYAQIFGIQSPWKIREVALNLGGGEVVIRSARGRALFELFFNFWSSEVIYCIDIIGKNE